jgi:hypothetical protein
MLTNRQISQEATEVVSKNLVVKFEITHNHRLGQYHGDGLRGLGYRWSNGLREERFPKELEDFKWKMLDRYLRNKIAVILTIRSSFLRFSRSVYCTNRPSSENKHDAMFSDVLQRFIETINSSPSIKQLRVNIQSDDTYVVQSISQSASKRLHWHLRPLESLLDIKLKLHMLNVKDEDVRMDDPDVRKNLQDLEDTERRGFISKSHLAEATEAGYTTDYSSGTGSENYNSDFSDSDSDDDGHVNHTGGLGTVRIIDSSSDS